jgi:hypothetical protein
MLTWDRFTHNSLPKRKGGAVSSDGNPAARTGAEQYGCGSGGAGGRGFSSCSLQRVKLII